MILEEHLQQRNRMQQMKAFKKFFHSWSWTLDAVVANVTEQGEFELRFPCLADADFRTPAEAAAPPGDGGAGPGWRRLRQLRHAIRESPSGRPRTGGERPAITADGPDRQQHGHHHDHDEHRIGSAAKLAIVRGPPRGGLRRFGPAHRPISLQRRGRGPT